MYKNCGTSGKKHDNPEEGRLALEVEGLSGNGTATHNGREEVYKPMMGVRGWAWAVTLATQPGISQDTYHKFRSAILGNRSVGSRLSRSGHRTWASWVCQLSVIGGSSVQL